MPWQGMSPVDLRMQLVSEYRTGLWSMTELAQEYGISRKTGYKWVDRYAAGGPGALVDRSRRPHGHPATTSAPLVAALLAVRRRHPHWGPRKLLAVMHRQRPDEAWPGRSTVAELLRRHGLIVPQHRRAAVPHGTHALAPMPQPNATWTTDFKGEFRTGDRRYCYPLTLRDGFSRYVLRCDALLSRSTALTRPCFERAFREYGLPERIRSDNGEPFASVALGRLSRLNVWWMRLGIVPERIALGRPEQNGSHEQFHAVLKAETARPPAADQRAQQARFRRFVHEYNEERPHERLGDRPPAAVYQPSPRPLPARLPPVEYPGHYEVRLVSSHGTMSWGGTAVFLTEVLAGEHVGLEEVDEGVWTLVFASTRLARFDARTQALCALPAEGDER